MQDDLVNLMTSNLRLSNVQPPVSELSAPSTPPASAIAYTSQHYHHSAHVAAPHNEPAVTSVLQSRGINANVLLPCQLQLFQDAQLDQRERLIELWSIAPLTYGNQLMPQHMTNWPQTSLELEEQAAYSRWEKQESERLRNLVAVPTITQSHAEPYMTNGYADGHGGMTEQQTEPRQAMEPVYQHTNTNAAKEWWHMAEEEPIEHQYGMLEQLRMMGFCGISNNKDTVMS